MGRRECGRWSTSHAISSVDMIKLNFKRDEEALRSVAEIAELTGYRDPTYFGAVFRRYEGTTPTEYRRTRML